MHGPPREGSTLTPNRMTFCSAPLRDAAVAGRDGGCCGGGRRRRRRPRWGSPHPHRRTRGGGGQGRRRWCRPPTACRAVVDGHASDGGGPHVDVGRGSTRRLPPLRPRGRHPSRRAGGDAVGTVSGFPRWGPAPAAAGADPPRRRRPWLPSAAVDRASAAGAAVVGAGGQTTGAHPRPPPPPLLRNRSAPRVGACDGATLPPPVARVLPPSATAAAAPAAAGRRGAGVAAAAVAHMRGACLIGGRGAIFFFSFLKVGAAGPPLQCPHAPAAVGCAARHWYNYCIVKASRWRSPGPDIQFPNTRRTRNTRAGHARGGQRADRPDRPRAPLADRPALAVPRGVPRL